MEQLAINTFQLDQVLTKDRFTKGSFAGVYACDQLSSIEISKYLKLFVVNTDPMELPGAHWTAICFDENMKREFFDSYEKHPIHYNKHFLDFMNRIAVKWKHNKIQLQSAFSTVCVQYCIYFLYHWCRKRSMSSIANSFVNDKLHNDQLVYDFVRRKYKQIHPSLKQDTNFVVKQVEHCIESSEIERVKSYKCCVLFLCLLILSSIYKH